MLTLLYGADADAAAAAGAETGGGCCACLGACTTRGVLWGMSAGA